MNAHTPTRFDGWSPQNVVRLQSLWQDGLTATQIARALGEPCTRNAVIGKLHRAKLFSRGAPKMNPVVVGKPAVARLRPQRAVAVRAVRLPKPKLPPRPMLKPKLVSEPAPRIDMDAVLPASRPVTLMERTESQCCWPIGDPKIDTFRYCGAPRASEGSYCKAHRLALRAPREA